MDPCNQIQEKLARGRSLSAAEREHAADCQRCLDVAAECGWLDAAVAAVTVPVPSGFADRVMAGLPALDAEREGPAGPAALPSPPALRWYHQPWAEFAFANGAALVTALNVVRLLARVFVSQTAFGGSP
jgi:hypothetical protein